MGSIISGIFSAISVIKELIKLFHMFMDMRDKQRKIEAAKREQEREAAVDKQKVAQTEEEFDNAQDTIVGNKP